MKISSYMQNTIYWPYRMECCITQMKKLNACWKLLLWRCNFENMPSYKKFSSFCSFLWHFNINFPNFFNVLGNNWNLLCSFHFIFYHKIFLREHLSAWKGVFYSPFWIALDRRNYKLFLWNSSLHGKICFLFFNRN